jgi:hypothetical protein
MPSLLDNSPNTVSECLEHGIPFLATSTGGIAELVAVEDRDHVLCEPYGADLAAALRRALEQPATAVARPGRDPRDSLAAWLELVDAVEPRTLHDGEAARRVTIVATGERSTDHARRLARTSRSVEIDVVTATSRQKGLRRAAADWVVFLDEDDVPDETMIDALAAAQAAADADAVTAAVRPADDPDAVQLFLGDPGSLGLIENQYGVVGLVRRSLLGEQVPEGAVDPDWPLFARLALAGARLVSVPQALSTHHGRVGQIADVPGEGLTVLHAFERARDETFPDLPALAATLAVSHSRLQAAHQTNGGQPRRVLQRFVDVLRTEGVGAVAGRASLAVRARSPWVRRARR